jgi:hypothetical protein
MEGGTGLYSLNEINSDACVGMEGKCDHKRGPLKEGYLGGNL